MAFLQSAPGFYVCSRLRLGCLGGRITPYDIFFDKRCLLVAKILYNRIDFRVLIRETLTGLFSYIWPLDFRTLTVLLILYLQGETVK